MLAGPSRITLQPVWQRVERSLPLFSARTFATSVRRSRPSALRPSPIRAAQQAGRRPRDALADAERQLEKVKKRPALAGFSAENQAMGLQDMYIFPPLHEIGIKAPGGFSKVFSYMFQRGIRWQRTTRSLLNLRQLGALPEKQAAGRWRNTGFYKFFANLAPSWAARPLVEEMKDLYIRYNQAQARGDHAALAQVSQGTALALAKSRSPNAPSTPINSSTSRPVSGQTLEWTLDRMISRPKLVHVRVFVVDPKSATNLAQVVVRFESDQTLAIRTYKRHAAATIQKQTSRVKEYYVFEREVTNSMSKWRLREKVTPYTGGDFSKIA